MHLIEIGFTLAVLIFLAADLWSLVVDDFAAYKQDIQGAADGMRRLAVVIMTVYLCELIMFDISLPIAVHHIACCSMFIMAYFLFCYLPVQLKQDPLQEIGPGDVYFEVQRSFYLQCLYIALETPVFVALISYRFGVISHTVFFLQAIFYAVTRLGVTVLVVHALVLAITREMAPIIDTSSASMVYIFGFPVLLALLVYTQLYCAAMQFKVARRLGSLTEERGAKQLALASLASLTDKEREGMRGPWRPTALGRSASCELDAV